MNLPYTLEATIEKFTDDQVVIITDKNERLTIPKSMISANATVGGTVQIAIFSEQDVATERERFAKQVLNELLQGN
ncbi:MAG: hypothetical protein ABIH67_05355 [Candidatus Uhrbacteria bacterium]